MLEMQFWLMSLGFLLLGLAIGDKMYYYLPKSIRKNKASIFFIPLMLGSLVLSIPLIGLLFGFPGEKSVIEQTFGRSVSDLENAKKQITEEIINLTKKYEKTNNTYEKEYLKKIIDNLEDQKKMVVKAIDYNINLFISCGLCIFTGSLISILLGRRNEKHEQ